MTPVDLAVIRRKLGLIINNLQALESIRDIAPARYREELFLRKGTERLLQETIEAAIDLNTHLLVQSGQAHPTITFVDSCSWPNEGFYLRTLPPPLLRRPA